MYPYPYTQYVHYNASIYAYIHVLYVHVYPQLRRLDVILIQEENGRVFFLLLLISLLINILRLQVVYT